MINDVFRMNARSSCILWLKAVNETLNTKPSRTKFKLGLEVGEFEQLSFAARTKILEALSGGRPRIGMRQDFEFRKRVKFKFIPPRTGRRHGIQIGLNSN